MKGTYTSLKKLLQLYKNKNFSFYNPEKSNLKDAYLNILPKMRKNFIKKTPSLLLGNLSKYRMNFSTRICNLGKYNSNQIIKKKVFIIDSASKYNNEKNSFLYKGSPIIVKERESESVYKISNKLIDIKNLRKNNEKNCLSTGLRNSNNYNNYPRYKLYVPRIQQSRKMKKKKSYRNIFKEIYKRIDSNSLSSCSDKINESFPDIIAKRNF